MATKVTRKELKEPDEFISFTQRLLTWVSEQKVALIIGVLALGLAIIGVVGWHWYVTSAEKAASVAFVRAQEVLAAKVVPEDEQSEAPAGEETYATEEDKLRAALLEFETLKKGHSSTQPAVLATYFIGECQRRLGEHDKAIETLKAYLNEDGPDGELAIFAMEGIALSLEAQGKDDLALAQYLRLTEPPFDAQPDRGLYHAARLEQKAGKLKEAVESFNQILEKYPKTLFRQEIQGRLDRLPKVDKPAEEPQKETSAASEKQSKDAE